MRIILEALEEHQAEGKGMRKIVIGDDVIIDGNFRD